MPIDRDAEYRRYPLILPKFNTLLILAKMLLHLIMFGKWDRFIFFRVYDRPTQYNYLRGENETLGSHWPNTVITLMMHHGISTYVYGEKEC